MRMPPRKVLGAGLALAIAIGFGGFLVTSRPVAIAPARVEDNVVVRVFGLGTVEAQFISKIGFEVGAAITKIKVDHGDRVQKGAVLARLHDAEQAAKVAKAQS